MRSQAPHPFVRYRYVLLVIAFVAWAVAAIVLFKFKGNPLVPVSQIAAVAGITFIWSNGLFWWLELHYPHIEMEPKKYGSRSERSSGFIRAFTNFGLSFYFIAAILGTFTCIRVGLGS